MIKELPASMTRVVLAFVGTAVVAVLPLIALAMTDTGVRESVTSEFARYGGPTLLVGVVTVCLMTMALAVKSVLRRKPRAASA